MFKKKKNYKTVTDNQYRAVITYHRHTDMWTASIEKRLGIDKWQSLLFLSYGTKEEAEASARKHIMAQKNLDIDRKDPIQYIIYDD